MQKTVFVSEVASSLFCLLALYSRVSGSICCPSRSLAFSSLTAARWLHQSVLPPARGQGGGNNGFSKAADPCLPTIRALGALIYLFSAKCSHFAVSAKAEDFCSQITAEREDSTEQKLYYSRGHMSWHRVFGAFVSAQLERWYPRLFQGSGMEEPSTKIHLAKQRKGMCCWFTFWNPQDKQFLKAPILKSFFTNLMIE